MIDLRKKYSTALRTRSLAWLGIALLILLFTAGCDSSDVLGGDDPEENPTTGEGDGEGDGGVGGEAGEMGEPGGTGGTGTITFNIADACSDGRGIRYRFFDVDNNLLWPNTSQVYVLTPGGQNSKTLNCTVGARICFGAEKDPADGTYWGVGINRDQGCDSCCFTCSGQTVPVNLRC